jgi:hypothetical protein
MPDEQTPPEETTGQTQAPREPIRPPSGGSGTSIKWTPRNDPPVRGEDHPRLWAQVYRILGIDIANFTAATAAQPEAPGPGTEAAEPTSCGGGTEG